jgi:hypothetical protein
VKLCEEPNYPENPHAVDMLAFFRPGDRLLSNESQCQHNRPQ